MDVNFFYKIVHLSTTILMIGLILNIWVRYIQIEKKHKSNINKNSNSLLFFALALLLWEYNLFDTDYRYEVFTTIIVDTLLLMATSYFNDGVLVNISDKKSGISSYTTLPIISILLILISNILINNYPSNLLIGYSGSLIYTFFTFVILSARLFIYYKNRNWIEIGIVSSLLFFILYVTIIISIVYSHDPIIFGWIKAFYITSTFGLYLIFSNLSFSFFQDVLNRRYSRIFTGVIDGNLSIDSPIANPVNFKEDTNRLIAEDKIEEVIEILLLSSQNDNERMTSILLLANRLASINTARLRDTINYETYRIDRNKIVDSLIRIIIETK